MYLEQHLAARGATEAAAREDVRRIAESLRAPHEDFNGEAFLIVPG